MKFKAGDKVVCVKYGIGTVVDIASKRWDHYPVEVDFGRLTIHFDPDGHRLTSVADENERIRKLTKLDKALA